MINTFLALSFVCVIYLQILTDSMKTILTQNNSIKIMSVHIIFFFL